MSIIINARGARMTREGKENRFGIFILDDSQVERVQSGDMSAVWEFIEQNRRFLTAWARRTIETTIISGVNKYGERTHYAEYRLREGN